MASTLPAPLTSGLFSEEEALDKQLRRANKIVSEGKQKRKGGKRGADPNALAVSTSLELSGDFVDPAAPVLAAAAWATPNSVPEKMERGKSSRLYL